MEEYVIWGAVSREEIDPATRVARYLDHSKFEKLLKDRALWFASTDSFSDQRERTIPKGFFKNWDDKSIKGYQAINAIADKVVGAYVTCWTKFAYENYALWKIFDPKSEGACVVTTFDKLQHQVGMVEECVVWAPVQYVDLFDDSIQYELPWVYFIDESKGRIRVKEIYKHQAYEYEKEIRGVIYRMKNTAKKGISICVDTDSLIDEIYLSPFMDEENEKRMIELIDSYGYKDRIRKSIILEKQRKTDAT